MKTIKITARIIFAAVCLLMTANFVMGQEKEEPISRSITSLDSKNQTTASGSGFGSPTGSEGDLKI